jgi:hypothetical protein
MARRGNKVRRIQKHGMTDRVSHLSHLLLVFTLFASVFFGATVAKTYTRTCDGDHVMMRDSDGSGLCVKKDGPQTEI